MQMLMLTPALTVTINPATAFLEETYQVLNLTALNLCICRYVYSSRSIFTVYLSFI